MSINVNSRSPYPLMSYQCLHLTCQGLISQFDRLISSYFFRNLPQWFITCKGYRATHVLAGFANENAPNRTDIATADHLMLTLPMAIKRFADKDGTYGKSWTWRVMLGGDCQGVVKMRKRFWTLWCSSRCQAPIWIQDCRLQPYKSLEHAFNSQGTSLSSKSPTSTEK